MGGAAGAAAAVAVWLHPGAEVPWDAVLYPFLFCLPGVLIARERERNPIGWLLLLIGACFAGNALALQWLASDHTSADVWVAWWSERGSALLVPATVLLLVVLPDGRLPSPAWRPAVRLALVAQ